MFIAKCMKPTKHFASRFLEALREARHNFIVVNDTIRRDLKWFLNSTFKNQTILEAQTLDIETRVNSG